MAWVWVYSNLWLQDPEQTLRCKVEVPLPQVSEEEVEAARARMIQVSLAAGSAAVRFLKAVASNVGIPQSRPKCHKKPQPGRLKRYDKDHECSGAFVLNLALKSSKVCRV